MVANILNGARGLVVRWLRCIYCTKVLSRPSHHPAALCPPDQAPTWILDLERWTANFFGYSQNFAGQVIVIRKMFPVSLLLWCRYVFWASLERGVLANLDAFADLWVC